MKEVRGFFLGAAALAFFFHASLSTATMPRVGELKLGRWVGYLQVEESKEAIAATLDVFLNQPSDPKHFPKIRGILKLSLGGFNTSEYDTTVFSDIHFDYHSGLINLDEPGAALSISGYVYTSPLVRLEGKVQLPESGVTGKAILYYQDDSEPDPDAPSPILPPLLGTLSGQYEGVCAGKSSVMQLQTARGLLSENEVPSAGLHAYLISGRLGSSDFCPVRWCQLRSYKTANYDYLLGKITLYGDFGAESCMLREGELACGVLDGNQTHRCTFKKLPSKTKPFSQAPDRYRIKPTPEQASPLPDYAAARGLALVDALSGIFTGYLHHEARDLYQPIRLDVSATTSSENPHNENDVHLSVMSTAFLGEAAQAVFWSEKYERRPFYFRPGFVLEAQGTDSILEVTEWKAGLIRGNWFSRQFGKVGSFVLTKGSRFPALPSGATRLSSAQGTFTSAGSTGSRVRTVFATQPLIANKSYFLFQGDVQYDVGTSSVVRTRIIKGTYDTYSGAMGWLGELVDPDPTWTFATGTALPSGDLNLFIPGTDRIGVLVYDFAPTLHRRVSK